MSRDKISSLKCLDIRAEEFLFIMVRPEPKTITHYSSYESYESLTPLDLTSKFSCAICSKLVTRENDLASANSIGGFYGKSRDYRSRAE